jgi:hypothetical protein
MSVTKNNINYFLESSPVGLGLRRISQTVKYSDFTDGGSTAGTLTLTDQLPEGAIVVASRATIKTGFTGDTSAVLKLGKTSGEDEFTNGSTLNLYAADVVGIKAETAMEYLNAATTVYAQLTSATDFTLVTAGEAVIDIYYLSTVAELLNNSF